MPKSPTFDGFIAQCIADCIEGDGPAARSVFPPHICGQEGLACACPCCDIVREQREREAEAQ